MRKKSKDQSNEYNDAQAIELGMRSDLGRLGGQFGTRSGFQSGTQQDMINNQESASVSQPSSGPQSHTSSQAPSQAQPQAQANALYGEFYSLTRKPFSIDPDPDFIYWAPGHRRAFTMLRYGMIDRAGLTVVTGAVGCGKTTLIQKLLQEIDQQAIVGLLSTLNGDIESLLSWVLMAFDLPFEDMTEVGRTAALKSFLEHKTAQGKRCILIVDEAQNLTISQLEQLRTLTNVSSGSRQLLQLILVGQPQLRAILQRPEMVQFVQRIASDFHLRPLSRKEVGEYITSRLQISGALQPIFSERAIDLVFETTGGVPRLINILCDTALVYGFSQNEVHVGRDIVAQVIRDKNEYGVFGYSAELYADPVGARTARDEAITQPQTASQNTDDKPALVINDRKLAELLLSKLQGPDDV